MGQFVLIGLLVVLGLSQARAFWPDSLGDWAAFLVGVSAIGVGGSLVVRAFVDLGESLTPVPRPLPDGRLVVSGIYAHLRHPIYAGLMLASLGWSAMTRSIGALAVALLLAAFLDAKARREEAWLGERYEGYQAYRARSKRFVPRIY